MKTQSLDGMWKVRWADGTRGREAHAEIPVADDAYYFDAEVPGEIHRDMIRAGIIREPTEGLNHLACRWVEETVWSYRKVFDVAPSAMKAKRVWFVFEQLDLAARIVLNGEEIATHSNSYHPFRVEVTGKLKARGNVLVVHIESGLFHAAEKPVDGCGMTKDGLLHKRVWLRKPQCQFGWDWSTRLINLGISGGVRLEYTDDPVRLEAFVPLVTVEKRHCEERTRDEATQSQSLRGNVTGRFHLENLTDKPVKVTLGLRMTNDDVRMTTCEIEAKPGMGAYDVALEVENPKLWWPIGCGEQNRYTVSGTVKLGRAVIGQCEKKIGFRTVEVCQDPHPKGGRFFILKVNGRPIFVKGGNFVPPDMIFQRIDRARYARLVDLAIESNYNMLRIWGGGLYESEDFYDLCDEKGILVWQEFIFACGKYPAYDRAFYESVKTEATYQIRRLAHRASLVVWCGNNEMEWGAWSWHYDKEGMAATDYHLFHLTLPRLLAEEDGTHYYHPSSPFSPDGKHPNADDVGDQHPWTVGFGETDFRKYREMACRFPNEGGILGPNSLPTVMSCLPQGHQFVQSFAWHQHDNSIANWGEPSPTDKMIRQWLDKDIRAFTIPEWVYWGGLVQGEGLAQYCENFRRRMFDTSSAIFWMYNDYWPTVRSWSIVDQNLRRNPSFWYVKRALAPVHVIFAEEEGEIRVFGVNDGDSEVSGTLEYGIFALNGVVSDQWSVVSPVTLPANASTVIARFPSAEWKKRKETMPYAVLRDEAGNLISRNRYYEHYFHEMAIAKKPSVRIAVKNGIATFTSPVFVQGACLDLDGETPLADNFFDLYPGQPYAIPWPFPRKPAIIF
ncbi:MAG: hypothetical protein FWF84_05660 [Kiritimatiellaeota bacterium]|nr:hypothetical protein [Kiritimatiellota bacterium]